MLALKLAQQGMYVFPVGDDGSPLTQHGLKDASTDVEQIKKWWAKSPNAFVGVHTGRSNILVIDVDVKANDQGEIVKDGFHSLSNTFNDVPDTFDYDSRSGLGKHYIYQAPEGVNLDRRINYQGLDGVDRLGGEGYIIWNGGVPSREDFKEPAEWMCDPAEVRKKHEFEGSLLDWYENLVQGKPNILVRKAIEKIDPDMGHSDMVAQQHAAIRLGAEGNPGVPEFLDALREAWEGRPAENHTTPEAEWGFKFEEALLSGLEKYGALTEQLAELPEYNLGLVPPSIPDHLVTAKDTGKAGFSKLLGALVKETGDDKRIATILWNSPATKTLAREWGLQFVFRRIEEARHRPEPTRENPRIEENRELEVKQGSDFKGNALLTEEEREYLRARPNFVDRIVETAKGMGYDQLGYFRSVGWVVMSMAFAFKGFIPMSQTHKLGTNLWFILPGESGTGKSVTGGFRDDILKILFLGDAEDVVAYDLGDDSSPQGLHSALIERDRMASLFSSDEATGFFDSLGLGNWKTSISERLTSWYNGFVQGSNKLSQKELRGKSALTSLSMHMFGTPDKLANVIHTDMFESGFMARVMWVFGNPPRNDSSRFNIKIDTSNEAVEFDEVPKPLKDHAVDLISAVAHLEKPHPILPGVGVERRLSEAYERMYRTSEGRENWHLVEPSLTRLSESMLKMTMLGALYRGDTVMQMEDALHAIRAMEEYFDNLHRMAGLISSGQFQRRADEIEQWIRGKGGKASRASIFHRFRNFIERDSREIDNLLTYLVESGALNRKESGNTIMYEING